jgi:hypothetical protein
MKLARSSKLKIIAALAVLTLLGLWAVLRPSAPSARPPLPNPNGYEAFVKAGQIVVSPTPAQTKYLRVPAEELPGLVATNREALKRLREGLTQTSQVPWPATPDMTVHLQSMASFKILGHALRLEGRLAELEGRTLEAARTHLENIQFGQAASRGGVMIDKLFGLSLEALGRGALLPLVTNLTARECRDVITALEQIEAGKESAGDVLANELAWVRQTWPRSQRVLLSVSAMIREKSLRPNLTAQSAFAAKCEARDIDTGHLLIRLAARAYELEKGRPPTTVNDLAPEYLQSLPKSPTTGKPLPLK